MREQKRLGPSIFDIVWDEDFLDGLAEFDKLSGSGLRVNFETTFFGPVIGRVMVGGVAEEQAIVRAMDDHADITAGANGPESLIFRFFEFVELQTGVGGVELEIERGNFDGLLFIAGEAGKATGEGVSDAKLHQ